MKSIKKILKLTTPLLLGGFLVWYSLKDISLNTILEHLKNANYWWIGLALVFGALSHFSRAYRWKYLLNPLGYKPDFTNSVMAVLVAYLVNLVLPRAGELSRATVMQNYDDIPFEKSFGTIVAERISDVVMILLVLGITLFIQFDFIFDFISKKEINPLKIGIILTIALISIFVFQYFFKKKQTGFFLKIKTFFLGLIEGVLSIFKMKHKWSYIGHTFFIWAMYILMFWVTTKSIDGLAVSLDAVLVGFIAGSLSIAVTNGGIGLYPIAVAGAFSLFGLDSELSKAFGWIMWISQTLMVIAFGGLSFLMLPIYNAKKITP